MKYILTITSFLLFSVFTIAQDGVEMDYQKPISYEVGDIKVEGARYSDDKALVSISGLKVGTTIKIPGQEIPRAIKRIFNLHLFDNVEIFQNKVLDGVIFLTIKVSERSRYSRHSFEGAKKQKHEDLNEILSPFLIKGSIVTDNDRANAKVAILKFYEEQGYLDAEVEIEEVQDENRLNNIRLVFKINRKDRVKIRAITFKGNKEISEKKLRKEMENTKQKSAIFKKSVFLESDYKEDLESIIVFANNIGFRDARILGDSMWRDSLGLLNVDIDFQEGNRYYFGDITWKGNSIYDDKNLERILAIDKGDVYNKDLLDSRLTYNAIDGRDVTSVYMDNGYLFFRIEAIERAIRKDTIDLEMRIFEGPQATIDRVEISGNDKTHEHVIRRELRTKPSNKFSRSDIIRSQREIINLGYFNPESLGINTPVNAEAGTVDIIYDVEEKSSDQLELSAGWGAGQIIGTIGVSFNNFSLRNILNKESWQPVPQGDGQRLSVRGQTNGEWFRSMNVSFTEPWLGGKKPTSFNVGGVITQYDQNPAGLTEKFSISRLTVGISTRLRWPDDNFIFSASVNFTRYELNGWSGGGQGLFIGRDGRAVTNGNYNNQSFTLRLARNSVNNPLYPTEGTLISLSSEFTLPNSLWFSDLDYVNGDLSNQQLYKWLEYHKWRFDFDWYTSLVGKLVLKASSKMGFVGTYNRDLGISPFERFIIQKDPLQQGNFQAGNVGADLFILRGYENNRIENSGLALPILNKFNFELRFPVTTNPQSTIYILAFAEAAKTFRRFKDFTPFDLQKSAGFGVRVFLPMFGLLGIDYGFPLNASNKIDKFSQGTLNFYLGFEPD